MRQKAELETKDGCQVRKSAISQPLLKAHAQGTQGAAATLLTLQRTRGNRFVQNLLKDVSPPHKCACGASGSHEKCETCSKKQPSKSDQAAIGAFANYINLLEGASHSGMNRGRGHIFSKANFYHNGLKVGGPAKALGVSEEEDDQKPRPMQGGASIQCNGSGDYEITYGNYAGAGCGTQSCVTAHESSHIADWKAKWPDGCKGQAKGYLPKGDPPDKPLMTVAEYNKFRNDSECKAHTADLECAEQLPKTAGCKTTVEDYIELTKKQKAKYDCGLSTLAKLGILGLVGAVVGGLLYAKYG